MGARAAGSRAGSSPEPRARSPVFQLELGGSSEAVTARPAVYPLRTQGGGGGGEGRRIKKEKCDAEHTGGNEKMEEKGRGEAEAGGRGRGRARGGASGGARRRPRPEGLVGSGCARPETAPRGCA